MKEITINNKTLLLVEVPEEFSKDIAIQLMKQGQKVTHRYFLDNEWIKMQGNIIKMEMGQECWLSEFFRYRTSEAWETGWSLFKD